MQLEINTTIEFFSRFMANSLNADQLDHFKAVLATMLHQKFHMHWDVNNPQKGNAYRSLSIISGIMDPIVSSAASEAGIDNVSYYFPSELMLWVDPACVSYRTGDYGYITTIYEGHSSQEFVHHSSPSPTLSNASSATSSPSSSPSFTPRAYKSNIKDTNARAAAAFHSAILVN